MGFIALIWVGNFRGFYVRKLRGDIKEGGEGGLTKVTKSPCNGLLKDLIFSLPQKNTAKTKVVNFTVFLVKIAKKLFLPNFS